MLKITLNGNINMVAIIATILFIISIKYTFTSIKATAEASLFEASLQQIFVFLVTTAFYALVLYLLQL